MIMMKEITTYEEFTSFKNQDDNVLRIVKIGAEWCGPCRTLSSTLQSLDDEDIQIAEVDIENEGTEQIATDYMVRSIPVTLFIKNGNVVSKNIGLISKNELLNIINLHK